MKRTGRLARAIVFGALVGLSIAVSFHGCSSFARPVGAPAASLSEPQRLLATYGGAIESSRRLLTVTTEAVGLALSRGAVTVDQVRTYRDAAVAADTALTVAAVALQAAVEAPDATREQRAIDALSAALAAMGRARALAPSGAGGGG